MSKTDVLCVAIHRFC